MTLAQTVPSSLPDLRGLPLLRLGEHASPEALDAVLRRVLPAGRRVVNVSAPGQEFGSSI